MGNPSFSGSGNDHPYAVRKGLSPARNPTTSTRVLVTRISKYEKGPLSRHTQGWSRDARVSAGAGIQLPGPVSPSPLFDSVPSIRPGWLLAPERPARAP